VKSKGRVWRGVVPLPSDGLGLSPQQILKIDVCTNAILGMFLGLSEAMAPIHLGSAVLYSREFSLHT